MSLFKGYHIIIVPQDKAQARTLKVSSFSLKVLVFSIVLSAPLLLISLLSTIHYQDKIVAMKRHDYENRRLLKSKRELIERIALVEKNIGLMDDTLANLGKVMDIDLHSVKAGVGPVVDSDLYLPEDESSAVALEALQVDTDQLVDEWLEENGDISVDKFSSKLAALKADSTYLNAKIQDLFVQSKDKIRFASAIPSQMPAEGFRTSDFGMRSHPISGRYRMHQGLDIACPYGAPIRAPADGIVAYAGYHGGHGQVVVLDHGYGISSIYAHASKIHVKLGDKVARDDLIAKVGSSGATTGPHLHYEVRVDGLPVDPMAYIAGK